MFLSRIHLDPRNRDARRDLADPYELHSTLCRAFSPTDRKCPEGEFLWRLEPEADSKRCPRVLIQSRSLPDWTRIGIQGWLSEDPDPSVDLQTRLGLNLLRSGHQFRFRLRANPCVTRNGKRLGLLQLPDQEAWLERKGREQHGFRLRVVESFGPTEAPTNRVALRVWQEQMLRGRRRLERNQEIRVFSVLYDGVLEVTDPGNFLSALRDGVGHGKAMGLGLLSVAPTV